MNPHGRPRLPPAGPRERVRFYLSPRALDTLLDRAGDYSLGGYLCCAIMVAFGEGVPPRLRPTIGRDGAYFRGVSANLPAGVAAKVRGAARISERSAWLERTLTPAVFDATDLMLASIAHVSSGRAP